MACDNGPCATPRPNWRLHDCNGQPLSTVAQVPTCEQMHEAIEEAIEDAVGSSGLNDCNGAPHAPGAQVPTCAQMDAAIGAGPGGSILTQFIVDGDTTHAPSGDAVFDALNGLMPNGPVLAVQIKGPLGEFYGDASLRYDYAAIKLIIGNVDVWAGPSSGGFNVAVGRNALLQATTSSSNTAVGHAALQGTTSGGSNTAIGDSSMISNVSGSGNSALGVSSLSNNDSGTNNVALGHSALTANSTGSGNTAVGRQALSANTTGQNNVAVGLQALDANLVGSGNVGLGPNALGACTGSNNVGIGEGAGVTVTSGNDNVVVGSGATTLAAGNNEAIVIGTNAVGKGSNTTVIGNDSTTYTYTFGYHVSFPGTAFGTPALDTNGQLVPYPVSNETMKLGYRGTDGVTREVAPATRVQSVVSAATVTPTFGDDMVKITAQAAALALANPTGTAFEGHGWVIRFKDDGTARAISYDTQYRAGTGVTLPVTTTVGKTGYLMGVWNATDSMMDILAVGEV